MSFTWPDAASGSISTHRPDPMAENSFSVLKSRQNGTLNFLTVEEGHFEGDTWVCDRYRNGDESNFELYVHRGEIVRIRLNPAVPC